jgi:hypothetical protein
MLECRLIPLPNGVLDMVVCMHALSRLADVSPGALYNSGKFVQKEVPPR